MLLFVVIPACIWNTEIKKEEVTKIISLFVTEITRKFVTVVKASVRKCDLLFKSLATWKGIGVELLQQEEPDEETLTSGLVGC